MRPSAQVIDLPQPPFSGKSPRKPRNKDVRSREYLTPDEVDRLMLSAGRVGRHPHRDKTLILIAYRHALRVSELVSLRWDQMDLKQGQLHVVRLKGGIDSTHPLRGPELRALKRLQREYEEVPVCVRDRAQRAADDVCCEEDRFKGRGGRRVGFPRASAHAETRLRVLLGERRL